MLNIDMTNKQVRVSASIGNDLTPHPVKLMTSAGELANDTYLLNSQSSIGSIAFNSTAVNAHVFHIDNVQVSTRQVCRLAVQALCLSLLQTPQLSSIQAPIRTIREPLTIPRP